ncbi:MAG: YdhR family protein [Desulfuromonadales bacterium]|nr:YdhR family protein [Desulfuromonadales bacterium]
MITALVQLRLPEPVTRGKARDMFSGTAPNYTTVRGLIRKYYLLSDDCQTAGGVYLWASRQDAELFYTDNWKKFIVEKYGNQPTITFFDTPVIVDNDAGQIMKDV